MRKNHGAPGIPVARLCRVPLTVIALLLTLLLGGTAMVPDALPAAALKSAALKTAGGPSAVTLASDADADEEDHSKSSEKREGKRGQPRHAARTALGAPRSVVRPLPAERSDSAPASAPPSVPRSAAAPSRPLQLPLLHCVFRC
ncbi:hypothetical protein ACWC2K_26485 [Streptomyces chattanoogensis]|uniref:hypothetical protein n=1 Tax=Streptomyces chattanoogensis TaxID=66876 RepID=UPI0036845632